MKLYKDQPYNPIYNQHLERLRELHESRWEWFREAAAKQALLTCKIDGPVSIAEYHFLQQIQKHNNQVEYFMEGVFINYKFFQPQ